MGRRPKATDLDGVLVVDKPVGPTSHDVVARLRRLMGQPRAGHTGTLDPGATGLLVVCFGRATKLVQYLQAGRKTYVADVAFGVTTTTLDADGDVIETRDASSLTADQIRGVAAGFVGDIEQIPPMVSAIRVDGKRLHELAREGKTVERAPRPVRIESIDIEDVSVGERTAARMTVTCSPGTYIRTLAADIGEALGVGASLTSLRRTGHGELTESDAVSLDGIEQVEALVERREFLYSIEQVLAPWPRRDVDAETARAYANGAKPELFGIDGIWIAWHDNHVIGLYADSQSEGVARAQVVLRQPDEIAPRPAQATSSAAATMTDVEA